MAWFFVCALLLAAGALVFIKNVSELAVDVAFVIVAGILGFGIPAIWQIVNGAIEQKEEDKRKGQDEEDRKSALAKKRNEEEEKKKEGKSDGSGITK